MCVFGGGGGGGGGGGILIYPARQGLKTSYGKRAISVRIIGVLLFIVNCLISAQNVHCGY